MEARAMQDRPTTNVSAKLLIAITFLPLVVIFAMVKRNCVKNPNHPPCVLGWMDKYQSRCKEKGVLPLPGRLFSEEWQERNSPAILSAIVIAALVGTIIGDQESIKTVFSWRK